MALPHYNWQLDPSEQTRTDWSRRWVLVPRLQLAKSTTERPPSTLFGPTRIHPPLAGPNIDHPQAPSDRPSTRAVEERVTMGCSTSVRFVCCG